MKIEYAGQTVNLPPCPFCGSDPLIHSYRHRMKFYFRIRCGNEYDICRMMPETSASMTLEAAAADWNWRPEEGTP